MAKRKEKTRTATVRMPVSLYAAMRCRAYELQVSGEAYLRHFIEADCARSPVAQARMRQVLRDPNSWEPSEKPKTDGPHDARPDGGGRAAINRTLGE
jgi:hypothetical protein